MSIKIQNVPVFWREASFSAKDNDIPSFYPLNLEFDQSVGIIKQPYSKSLDSFLQKIYQKSDNIGYLQPDNPLRDLYGPEFIKFIRNFVEVKGKEILEIGCGGLYTLEKLRVLGGKVTGCDPSPASSLTGDKLGIPIISEFYPSDKISNKFDLILHYDVLEHVWDPIQFIQQNLENLKISGSIAFVVPDCTDQIANCDISLFLHQHLNYFTKTSLNNMLSKFNNIEYYVTRSENTGVLMCGIKKVRKLSQANSSMDDIVMEETNRFFSGADEKYNTIISSIKFDLEKANEDAKVGFYPPLRAMPYIGVFLQHAEFRKNIVFIDDNTKVHGRFICDVNIPIVGSSDAEMSKCMVVYITSWAYREVIKNKITRSNPNIKIRYF